MSWPHSVAVSRHVLADSPLVCPTLSTDVAHGALFDLNRLISSLGACTGTMALREESENAPCNFLALFFFLFWLFIFLRQKKIKKSCGELAHNLLHRKKAGLPSFALSSTSSSALFASQARKEKRTLPPSRAYQTRVCVVCGLCEETGASTALRHTV